MTCAPQPIHRYYRCLKREVAWTSTTVGSTRTSAWLHEPTTDLRSMRRSYHGPLRQRLGYSTTQRASACRFAVGRAIVLRMGFPESVSYPMTRQMLSHRSPCVQVLYEGTRDHVKGVEPNQHDAGMQNVYRTEQAKGCISPDSGSRLLKSTQAYQSEDWSRWLDCIE